MVPAGPSTQASSTGTEGGAAGPGGVSTTAPEVDLITGGSAALVQEYSTVPSGRAVAEPITPRGVSILVSSSVVRS
jgi:hypothetical protein